MNFTDANITMDAFNASVNMMDAAQLHLAMKIIETKLECAKQKHTVAVRDAIEAARKEDFTVLITLESDDDVFTYCIAPTDKINVKIY